MLTRQHLDRIVLRITGEDIRLLGFWQPLPRLDEFRGEYARELGVAECEIVRCKDIVDVLDLAGNSRTFRQGDQGQPALF